jgi:hypothetical protein
MTRRQWLVIASAVMLSGILALALRDVIQRTIVTPALYLWWVAGIFYHSIPQIVLWAVMLFFVSIIALGSILPKEHYRRSEGPKRKPVRGPIEDLAIWIGRTRGGIYYKWLVANRLGKMARELLIGRHGQNTSRSLQRLDGRDWDPPDKVGAYLESGLNGSFADYPQPHWLWSKPNPTPLDLSPQDAIEFLESEMETSRDRHR